MIWNIQFSRVILRCNKKLKPVKLDKIVYRYHVLVQKCLKTTFCHFLLWKSVGEGGFLTSPLLILSLCRGVDLYPLFVPEVIYQIEKQGSSRYSIISVSNMAVSVAHFLNALTLITYCKLILCLQGDTMHFSALIDAGSSGSRIHVYQWTRQGNRQLLPDVKQLAKLKIKPGITAYIDKPNEVVEHIMPLLKMAKSRVPEEKQSSTSIYLMATAGRFNVLLV